MPCLLGIHINKIGDKNGNVKAAGPNPFEYLGIDINTDGTRGTPIIWNGSKWVTYEDLGAFAIQQQPQDKRGKKFKLKTWLSTYDWVDDDGFNNFEDWVA